nr:hypothetical protein CFP56_09730 [Quercus suber]
MPQSRNILEACEHENYREDIGYDGQRLRTKIVAEEGFDNWLLRDAYDGGYDTHAVELHVSSLDRYASAQSQSCTDYNNNLDFVAAADQCYARKVGRSALLQIDRLYARTRMPQGLLDHQSKERNLYIESNLAAINLVHAMLKP